jgi:pyrroline-5-carboxylate reductase
MSGKINLYVVGAGKMGMAMVRKWTEGQFVSSISIIEPRPSEELRFMSDADHKISLYSSIKLLLEDSSNGSALIAIDGSQDNEVENILILAVKPQIMRDVLEDILNASISDGIINRMRFDMVISIAAGIKLSFFDMYFSVNTAIARVMPNTPVEIGEGVSAYCLNKVATQSHAKILEGLLSPLGQSFKVDNEDQLHAITAVSGSGPAYIFALTESIAYAAEEQGLNKELAQEIAKQTVIGAAGLMAMKPQISASTLRENVTSPGGTTEAALNVLKGEDKALDKLINSAVDAAQKRSVLLSEL